MLCLTDIEAKNQKQLSDLTLSAAAQLTTGPIVNCHTTSASKQTKVVSTASWVVGTAFGKMQACRGAGMWVLQWVKCEIKVWGLKSRQVGT